jgi:hypothetical protein
VQAILADTSHAEFTTDPYSAYRQIQGLGFPICIPSTGAAGVTWLFSRYDDVAVILKEARTSKDISRLIPAEKMTAVNHAMLSKDPPDHTRLRSLAGMAFTPSRIKDLEPRIAQVAGTLIAHMQLQGETDFIAEFALPLPVVIIAELLGVPVEDRTMFREWSNQVILGGGDANMLSDDNVQRDAVHALTDYFAGLIAERRKRPQADLVSDLIRARDAQSRLTEQELIGTCILLLIAGHETTANLLGSGMFTLLRHPDQWALLKEHPEHVNTAIEEMLRFESPLQQATFRVAGESFQTGAVTVEKGQQITALIGAANRDPKYFPNPDRFDITRAPNKHIAFGLGIHFCLGAALARAEGFIGFSKIIERLPNMRLLDETPRWNPNACLRGLSSLQVVLS